MPAYRIRCEHCGDADVTAPIADGCPTTCPTCTGPVRQVYAPTRAVFHGTGWTRNRPTRGRR